MRGRRDPAVDPTNTPQGVNHDAPHHRRHRPRRGPRARRRPHRQHGLPGRSQHRGHDRRREWAVVAPVVVPAYAYGYGYGHPFGFGIFGFLGGLFFLFIIFGLLRAIFWRGGYGRRGGWGPGGWGRPGGPGRPAEIIRPRSGRPRPNPHWEARANETFEDWHRRAHAVDGSGSPSATPPDRRVGPRPGDHGTSGWETRANETFEDRHCRAHAAGDGGSALQTPPRRRRPIRSDRGGPFPPLPRAPGHPRGGASRFYDANR